MITLLIIYLYISTILLVYDLIKHIDVFYKYDEDIEEFSNLEILFLAAFVIISGLLTVVPYYIMTLIKKVGS